ncbi:MAG: tRNA 2-thiouridine(34) synthase MnmA [Planctomycetaceae bacterium]
MARVVVAMSGGVDSSVAAALVQEAGHDVIGVFMRHAPPILPPKDASTRGSSGLTVLESPQSAGRPGHGGCCSAADALDARRVADRLGIPLSAIDMTDDFERIIDYFVNEYGRGRTPNPCVRCNTWLKFGKLLAYADAVGAEFVATGHHARVEPATDGGQPRLMRGRDRSKDQSYVLFESGAALSRMLLPVGDLLKDDVRNRAGRLGLITADKPDSQEICFVAAGDHARLVAHRLGSSRSGQIVDTAGKVLGQHDGIEHFTVGQRQGLGVAVGSPRYVVRIEPESRRVVVGSSDEVPIRRLVAAEASWLGPTPRGPLRCRVQCRSACPAAPAVLMPRGDDRFDVEFESGGVSPGAISPGQAAVCYDGDRVLGGGWIEPLSSPATPN